MHNAVAVELTTHLDDHAASTTTTTTEYCQTMKAKVLDRLVWWEADVTAQFNKAIQQARTSWSSVEHY